MLKKLLSFALVFVFVTVQASAATDNGLKAAFDEMNYGLIVEWDQQDKDFYTQTVAKFTKTVADLQAQGLSNAELLDFLKAEVKDQQFARDLDTLNSLMALNKVSASEANDQLLASMKRAYSTGVSWDGYMVGAYAATAVLVGLFVWAIASASKSPGTNSGTSTYPYCYQSYQCYPFCYNDAIYGYTCQQNCYWLTQCE